MNERSSLGINENGEEGFGEDENKKARLSQPIEAKLG